MGTVNRPLRLQATDDTALYEEMNSITQDKQAVIIGDFNCPNADWNLMHGDQLKWLRMHSSLKLLTNQHEKTIS